MAGLAVAKVIFFDLSSLDALYRVGSVFLLALVALSLAYLYYRHDRSGAGVNRRSFAESLALAALAPALGVPAETWRLDFAGSATAPWPPAASAPAGLRAETPPR